VQSADVLYTDLVATVNPDFPRRVQNSGLALIKGNLLFAEVLRQLCGMYAFDRPKSSKQPPDTESFRTVGGGGLHSVVMLLLLSIQDLGN
jgi:hypothetical protein